MEHTRLPVKSTQGEILIVRGRFYLLKNLSAASLPLITLLLLLSACGQSRQTIGAATVKTKITTASQQSTNDQQVSHTNTEKQIDVTQFVQDHVIAAPKSDWQINKAGVQAIAMYLHTPSCSAADARALLDPAIVSDGARIVIIDLNKFAQELNNRRLADSAYQFTGNGVVTIAY
ncbi:hypothetical protein LH991_05775 [Schleiferilactobacillus harbinensis]|jgi:hypothetical protein|uniref:hypothetical protein n=1 Tax=Schleiferilactobacillus harbinensis TaxID=304207 RepID=UPI000ACD8099|nr:hypothetical protein [Schleiferilactobacillus harbinensis]MBO3092693.1 hypothetical protein [Schleiferilactobacillus harbinensis]QFR63516.1 hypothetical protein LH991_05775 [Schleiferilactobacillus harbinensis]